VSVDPPEPVKTRIDVRACDNQVRDRVNRSPVTKSSLKLAQNEHKQGKTNKSEIVAILQLAKAFH